jgi:shikimate dehydrogenase
MENSKATKKFAVIGNPVEHSRSPEIFEDLFGEAGLDYQYQKILATENDLPALIEKIRTDEYSGYSVTVPFKETAIEFLDELTDAAREIGAVNTVYKNSVGKIVGANTDWIGFKKSLLKNISTEDLFGTNKKVLIYGAGGAARACLYALREIYQEVSDLDEDFSEKVYLTNRTEEKGRALAENFGAKFVSPNNLPPNINVLINTTSVNLTDKDQLIVPEDFLRGTGLVFDLMYGETALIRAAQKLGIQSVDGSDMLLEQAKEQFNIFTG